MSGVKVSACVYVVDQRVISVKNMSGVKVSACVYVVDQRVISKKEYVWSESKCMCVYSSGSEGNI